MTINNQVPSAAQFAMGQNTSVIRFLVTISPNHCAQICLKATGMIMMKGVFSSCHPSTVSTNFKALLIRTNSDTAHYARHSLMKRGSVWNQEKDRKACMTSASFTYSLIIFEIYTPISLSPFLLSLACSRHLPTFIHVCQFALSVLLIPSPVCALIMDSIKRLQLPPNELLL